MAMVIMLALASCANKEATEAIDQYVAQNSTPEAIQMVKASGFSDFSCERNGYDIINIVTFPDGMDLSSFTQTMFDDMKPQLIAPILDDYNKNEVAKKAIDAMNENDGNIIYTYRDNNGTSFTVTIPAKEIVE